MTAGRHWTHITSDGRRLDVLIYARKLVFEGRSSILASIIDVTAQRRAEARIEHMAHHDALTSLANRVLFRRAWRRSWPNCAGRRAMSRVLSIDLDYFKRVNDTLGHAVGDEVLRIVASRLKAAVRGGAVIARLGGDEFAIVQADVASARRGRRSCAKAGRESERSLQGQRPHDRRSARASALRWPRRTESIRRFS